MNTRHSRQQKPSTSPLKKQKSPEKKDPKPQKKLKTTEDYQNIQNIKDIAARLRIHSIEMTNASNSGHPSSCSSMADILSVLFFDKSGMTINIQNLKSFTADRFVLSKGHAAPILYAVWSLVGLIPQSELLKIRKFSSGLEGHPTPRLPFVDVATGSLGQGLGAACGMAYSSKYLDKITNRFYVLLGDGECAEGSVWEAASFAGHYKLDNLTAIVDVNRLGQSEETSLAHNVQSYKKRFESFDWNAIVIDGHDIPAIIKAFNQAKNKTKQPTVLIAKTLKGKDIPSIENKLEWHGKPLGKEAEEAIKHLENLIKDKNFTPQPNIEQPAQDHPLVQDQIKLQSLSYKKGEKIATRLAYGTALKRLGTVDTYKRLVSLDGDTKNSTYAITFKNAFPDRFIECYIAEQNMVSVATGLGCRNKIPFVSTFGAFFTRTYDQIRMGAISLANIKLVGSHCGVSIGEDGPSQMALEDIAMMRAIPNAIVLYPSDAVSTEKAVEIAANQNCIVYIRTSRPNTEVIYENEEQFQPGQCKTIVQSNNDKLVIVAGGVTLFEALEAQKTLLEQNLHIRVVDIFSVKPIDKKGLIKNAQESGFKILTVEDHYIEGGIHDAVCQAVCGEGNIKVFQIAVDGVPRSGTCKDLMDHYKLSAQFIVEKVKELLV